MTTTKYGSLYPKEFLNYFGNSQLPPIKVGSL